MSTITQIHKTRATRDRRQVIRRFAALCVLAWSLPLPAQVTTNFVGLQTNGPAVFQVFALARETIHTNIQRTLVTTNGVRTIQQSSNLQTNVTWTTNRSFAHLVTNSFNYMIWTNVLARTNGATTQMWSERRHPEDWPKSAPMVKWNRKSLVYGMTGFTALSPCWEGEGSSGQVPITALTRRHGYTRGHGMGEPGFGQRFAGKKVWFLPAKDRLVTARVAREVVRTQQPDKRDYTILLFDRDLPTSITPMGVVEPKTFEALYPYVPGGPRPLYKTEQGGHVSADLPGFTVNTWKGGDSGSPNILPLGNELVFFSGRSTSGPSAEMQADMDELCRLQKLNPAKHPLRWVAVEHQ
jgi:hypothetical protein